jgi:hypothetical protein
VCRVLTPLDADAKLATSTTKAIMLLRSQREAAVAFIQATQPWLEAAVAVRGQAGRGIGRSRSYEGSRLYTRLAGEFSCRTYWVLS